MMRAHTVPVSAPAYDEPLALFINGNWRTGRADATHVVINPATEAAIGTLALADTQDLDDALAAADAGFKLWSKTPAIKRAQIIERAAALLHERAERIGTLMSYEHGKTIADGTLEVRSSADIVKWFAEEGRRAYGRIVPGPLANSRQLVLKVPVGPVAAFSPWNFPVRIAARTVSAALAAGCSVILKAAEETPASAIAMVRCFEEAGLPPGVLNLVFGIPSRVSAHLIGSRVIRAVSFTGSIPTGKLLLKLAADGVKKVVMELGGHAPVVVCNDVDVDRVVTLTAGFKYRSGGQACISPTRFYVHRTIYDEFTEKFARFANAVTVGAGQEAGVQMGPVANARRLAAMETLVADAVAHGAQVAAGGHRLDRTGFFYAPTVLTHVPDDAQVMNEEPFGPIAPIAAFDTLDDVILRANRLEVGLAAYAFTRSAANAMRLSEEIEAGMVGINSTLISGPELPFGGVKESGIGSENGLEGLQAYLITKFVQQAVL